MSIQVFLPKFRVDECLEQVRECLEKSWTGIGFKTTVFEQQWCDYTGLAHAHFLNSNTVGLHLAFNLFKSAYGWQDDDEVITTPLTFISTNHAILYEHLKPVFADVDDTLCLSPQSIEKCITAKTKAVIYVGIGGNTGHLDDVAELCRQHGLKLILDAAHMAGTYYKNRHVGYQADVTIFSFQAVKNLPTADSGMICFRDKLFDDEVRKLSWLGINKDTYARTTKQGNYKWKYDVEQIGFKYHGNSIMAALGLVGLKYLDEDNRYRRELAQLYKTALSSLPQVRFVEEIPDCQSAQHLFQIRIPQRDTLLNYLYEHDIFPGVHYRDNTEYKPYSYALGTCPNAAQASEEVLSLPLHLHLTPKDINYISEVIKKFYTEAPQVESEASLALSE
ncbi:DegT/DnrJ/EryC1/StrS family aminotransferase [Legionella fairfieldensis]|uniref:DegT/DnrJ/EryC1/StrS family aminotransferase n=1 Tax=Legionella fairfieldensis TaxID=45064 RepID=UPI000688EDA4|nr:DegT/DnrJ/EryC1/StrS family aminotransferase [Legionella fairfieldensis]